jgi:hypothetical protein
MSAPVPARRIRLVLLRETEEADFATIAISASGTYGPDVRMSFQGWLWKMRNS